VVIGRAREGADESEGVSAMDDDAIVALVRRLARPHASGGNVIERAAIMAAGSDSPAVIAWILCHSGTPEASPSAGATRGGLHGSRLTAPAEVRSAPRRYVLPAGVL
jgi:hypothetical protein